MCRRRGKGGRWKDGGEGGRDAAIDGAEGTFADGRDYAIAYLL